VKSRLLHTCPGSRIERTAAPATSAMTTLSTRAADMGRVTAAAAVRKRGEVATLCAFIILDLSNNRVKKNHAARFDFSFAQHCSVRNLIAASMVL
jgi:hypothetical protein